MKVRFLQAARIELREAVAYVESEQAGLGVSLARDVAHAVTRIQDHPKGWHPLTKSIRRCQLKRFSYGLVYLIENEEIVIVAVAHLSRHPRYWRSRLRKSEG